METPSERPEEGCRQLTRDAAYHVCEHADRYADAC